jgi:hypothetical protein
MVATGGEESSSGRVFVVILCWMVGTLFLSGWKRCIFAFQHRGKQCGKSWVDCRRVFVSIDVTDATDSARSAE